MESLRLVTPPSTEPLTVAEVLAHLRLDSSNLEPRPSAPTAVLANAGGGSVDNGVHRYRLTFVTADGETDGGDTSASVAVVDNVTNGRVSLTGLSLGGTFVTARRVYRTKVGGEAYFLVGTIANNTDTAFVDNVADAALGVGLPTINTTGDPTVRRLIKTAREMVEGALRRALIRQTWRVSLPMFPICASAWPARSLIASLSQSSGTIPSRTYHREVITLPRPQLLAVSSVQYFDLDNVLQTLDPTTYESISDALPGYIALAYGQYAWPYTYPRHDAVRITYDAGYGDTAGDVPEPIRAAMLLLIGDLYENPASIITGTIMTELPTYKRLIGMYKYAEVH